MKAKELFTEKLQKQVVAAIEKAELNTSGEVRVHLDDNCKGDVLDRAAYVFEKLEMHKTEQRNGVLFYLAVQDKKFAILGDAGINQKVPDNFWEEIKTEVISNFKKGDFAKGLSSGIVKAGEQLKAHFPYQEDDVNELENEISFDDEI
tara:strand:+ start:1357 stop:1800 length:444 start_codon:yes stop_codon:yes gene_type:complete